MGRARRSGEQGPLAALAAALLVATLTGCGSGGSEGSDGSAEDTGGDATSEVSESASPAGEQEEAPSEEAEPEPVAVPRKPFCDRIGDDVVEAAIGAPAMWEQSRRPGEKFQVTLGSQQVEESFFCRWQTNPEGSDYGAGEAALVVRVHGKALSAGAARKEIEESQQIDDAIYPKGCEEQPMPFASGGVSYARVCETPGDRYNTARATGSATALLGDALLTCFVEHAGKKQAGEVTAALEACAAVPEQIAS